MHLIYYAHSYRKVDDAVNEFFQELMLDEDLTPSLDPPSDRLNAAKPQRHLRSTDAMVAVLTVRQPSPSPYILYEIGLGMRARKPLLVFVEDVLPDDVVPYTVLQRRFCRRRLLREVRDHRHALRLLKTYIGADPPPTYEPLRSRRRCVVIGGTALPPPTLEGLTQRLAALEYSPVIGTSAPRLPDDASLQVAVAQAAVCVAVVDRLSPAEAYLIGVAQASLTPTIAITGDADYPYAESVPREYQPVTVDASQPQSLAAAVQSQIEVFEEDYLELAEADKVHRYREALVRSIRREGHYGADTRERVLQVFTQSMELDMSRDKIEVSNVVGPVNIKSRLEQVTQTVTQAPALADDQRQALAALLTQLQQSLAPVAEQRPDDADRVTRSAETVGAEVAKAKPDKDYLRITAAGLTAAAKAVADIAPPVLAVAAKVAAFIAAL